MDELEVQVEIACWAQKHPEAERINWKNGNEPWVTFEGKLCTLHVGLGGLVWSIEVPVGYQTELSPADDSRKRCWEPLDFHDTVIVQDKNVPFRVSVVSPLKDNCSPLESLASKVLVQHSQPAFTVGEVQEIVTNLLQKLQISDGQAETKSFSTEEHASLSLEKSRLCLQSMADAETLSQLLDAIYAFATTLCSWHDLSRSSREVLSKSSSMETSTTHDSADDDLFGPDLTLKWSWIKHQVECAEVACRNARIAAAAGIARKSIVTCERIDSAGTNSHERMVHGMESLEIAEDLSETAGLQYDIQALETTSDFAFLTSRSSTDICGINEVVNGSKIISRCHSDSQMSIVSGSSCDDWENLFAEDRCMGSPQHSQDEDNMDETESESKGQLSSIKKSKFQNLYNQATTAAAGSEGVTDTSSESTTWRQSSTEKLDCHTNVDDPNNLLQYCDIHFHETSFCVEFTVSLSQFMDNNIEGLSALGLSCEFPLRVEVVPNKRDVDGLSWTGVVEVYVSQRSEWHNHVSEEVCGLLCFVPHIVRHYFETTVPAFLHHRPTVQPKGELFTGLLQTVVTRLSNATRNCCCVCMGPLQISRTLLSRTLWPCDDNMCQALYGSWITISCHDEEERTAREKKELEDMEASLRLDYPYSESIVENLTYALNVYEVDSEGLHYGQMIRALARIELWNHRDDPP